MFAKEPIVKGETAVIWGGTYVGKKEAEQAKKQGKLAIHLDTNLFSVEERGDDPTYFINHSCNPNCWMENAFTLTTRRNIPKGKELTADYAMWEGESYVSKWNCVCGSSLCRKRITGQDWKLPELQKRYREHFSPLINKMIAKSK